MGVIERISWLDKIFVIQKFVFLFFMIAERSLECWLLNMDKIQTALRDTGLKSELFINRRAVVQAFADSG